MREEPEEISPGKFLPAGALNGANLAFRREALQRSGGFDPALGAGTPFPCEDVDAAAAVAWAGFPLRYDPRPIVRHHHGRRAADVEKLAAQYNKGGGAYYAKYLLRPDSRAVYLGGWWRYALASSPGRRKWRLREMKAFFAYLLYRRRYGFMIAAAPFWLATYAVLAVLLLQGGMARRLRTRAGAADLAAH